MNVVRPETPLAAIVAASEALARATEAGHCRLPLATKTCPTCGTVRVVAGPAPIACGTCNAKTTVPATAA